MRLIDDKAGVARKVWLREELTQQHAIGHVLNNCLLAGTILESNAVSHLMTNSHIHFVGYTSGNGHGRDSPGLRTPDLPKLGVSNLMEELRYLSCFT